MQEFPALLSDCSSRLEQLHSLLLPTLSRKQKCRPAVTRPGVHIGLGGKQGTHDLRVAQAILLGSVHKPVIG